MKTLKRKKQVQTRKDDNYVNNEDFLKEIISYKTSIKKNKDKNIKIPIPEKLAIYIIRIANNLSTKGNFISYTWRDEMVSDGIENGIQCLNSFDPKKSSNPFSYFSQIIWFAFVRRIKKENRHLYVKYKVFLESDLCEDEEVLTLLQKHDNLLDHKREFVENFEKSLKKKKDQKKCKKYPIEDFLE